MRLTEDNIADYADTLILQVKGGGVTLDYSEGSVGVLEELFRVSDELLRLPEFPEAQRNLVIFYNGCYLGETLARNLRGVWTFPENWYDSTLTFEREPEAGGGGIQVHPFHKIYRRALEGPEGNDLVAYYEGLKARLRGHDS